MPQITYSSHLRSAHHFSRGLAAVCASVLAVIGIIAVTGSHASSSQLYLSPANASVVNGSSVTLSVYANSGSTPVNAAQVNLAYNTAQLQYTGTSSAGSGMTAYQQPSGTPNTGSLQFTYGSSGGGSNPSGTFLLFSVSFKAVAGSGSAAVTFASSSGLYAASDSSNIVTSTGSANIALTSPATPTPTPTPVATVAPTATPTRAGSTPTPTPASGKTSAPSNATPTPAAPAAIATPAPGTALLYLSPASGTIASGSDFQVGVRLKTTTGVNSVQANLNYQTSGLTYKSVSNDNSALPLNAQTSGNNGAITIVRSTNGGATPVTGDVLVATIDFTVNGASGPTAINFTEGSVVLTASGSKNILANPMGGSYTVTGGSASGTIPTTTAGTGEGTEITLPISGTGTPLPVSGVITLTPGSTSDVEKITYQLDGHTISSAKVDTTYLKNGTHTITATITKSDGSTQTITQPLSVSNKLTGWQQTRNTVVAAFGGNTGVALGTVVTLAALLAAAIAFMIIRPHLEASVMQKRLAVHPDAPTPTGFGEPKVVMPAGNEPPSPLVTTVEPAVPSAPVAEPAATTPAAPETPAIITPEIGETSAAPESDVASNVTPPTDTPTNNTPTV